MKLYRRLSILFFSILLAYPVVGIISAFSEHEEAFPVYCWFLFYLTPNAKTDFALRILEHNSQPLPQPLLAHEADGFIPNPRSIELYELTQRFGRASQHNNPSALKDIQSLLQNHFLGQVNHYELVSITYDPLERWKSGSLKITPIQSFHTKDFK